MDSTDPSNALSSLTLSSNEENDENLAIVPSTKRTRFLATYRRQNFSLPKTIMLYLAKNPPTPEIYQKMIKTCKFFFVHNPILVLQDSTYNGFEWVENYRSFGQQLPSVHFKNLASKLWITGSFIVEPQEVPNIISSLIPKFFRFDAKQLQIQNQITPFIDYTYLASSVEYIILHDVTVKDENGSDLSLEKLVEIASKAKRFSCGSDNTILSNITSKTFGQLLKIPHFLELDIFYLDHIPETFDLEAFYACMKSNTKTTFILSFDDSISEAYQIRLEEIIDEIIDTASRQYVKPLLSFGALAFDKWLHLSRS